MKKLMSFLKSLNVLQILTGSLAILFLALNTACSQPNASAMNSDSRVLPASSSPSSSSAYRKDIEDAPAGQVTELYDTIQPEIGGMNNYSDVDPRQDTSEASRKTGELFQKAHRQQAEKVNNPREAIDEVRKELDKKSIGERAKDFSKNVGSSTQKKADDLTQATQKGVENISSNTKKLGENIKSATDMATKKVEKGVRDSESAVDRATQKISQNMQQGADEIQELAENEGRSVR